MPRPVIVCYDGSIASTEALEYTAEVVPSSLVLIVTVWREIDEEMLSSGAAPPAGDPVEVNVQTARAAQEAARSGAERARAARMNAEPLVIKTSGPTWRAIE